jgi:hypothetical protein
VNWLFPGFLAGAALVGLPVLLHFLRSRPKTDVPFPSLRFLGETAIRDTRRHRLRRWLTLLLRCLVIGLLAAAFARPFWVDAAAARRRAVVVAVDNSMSMQARGRWEEMRAWALQQLDELQPGDQAAVLTMHPAPTWIAPMTDDLSRVRATLQDAQPSFEKTRYAQALQIAGETLAANPAGMKTLVWMADEQRIGWQGVDLNRTLPPGVKVRLAPTALVPQRQAAIVALRRLEGDAPGLDATVHLYQPEQEQRRIAVRANGRVLLEQTAALRSGDNHVELRFAAPPDAPGVRVSLLDPDDLPADDAAWIASAKTAGSKVLLDKTDGADFLAHALRSTQRLEATGGALEPAPLPDGPWPAGVAVIVRGASAFRPPQLERLDRFVEAGGPVWMFVDGSPEQLDWLKNRGVEATERAASGEGNALHLRDWDPEHPILAAFAGQSLLPLLNVEFYRGFDLSGGTLLPLANWPDGKTALAEWNGEGRRILLAGFPLDRAATNWPAQPSFVPFVHQAARWLGQTGAARNDWRVGDSIPLPPGQGTWRAIDSAIPQPGRSVSGAVRPATPGLYEFAVGGERKVFAVNIPPEESDLSPWPQPEKLAALEAKDVGQPTRGQPYLAALPVSGEAAENQQRIWWWALAFCGACVLVELALANRTAM